MTTMVIRYANKNGYHGYKMLISVVTMVIRYVNKSGYHGWL